MSRLKLKGLQPGATYDIQLRAVEGDSFSEWSRVYEIAVEGDENAPDTPQWADTDPWIVDGTSFRATWKPLDPTPESNKDLAYYELLVSDGVNEYTVTTNGTSHVVTFEENSAHFGSPKPTLTASVRAVDESGNKSAYNAELTVSNPPPQPPASIDPTAITDGIGLVWAESVDTDVIGYRVHVGTTAGFTPTSSNRIFSGDALEFNYATLSYGTDHFFKVYAVDAFNQLSTTPTGTTTAVRPVSPFVVDTTPPDVPTGLAATIINNPSGVGAVAAVSWTMNTPPDDLAGFYVRYRKVGESNWSGASFQKEARAATIELQAAFTNYEFQIKAADSSANESAWSAIVTAVSPTNAAPANVTGFTSTAGKDSITYQWDAVADTDIRNYEVTFSTSSTFASGNITFKTGTATVLTVSGLDPNTTYYARVRAEDTGGLTSPAWSATDTETTGTFPGGASSDGVTPAAPTAPTVMGSLSTLYATWSPVTTNASGGAQNDPVTYEVHLSTTSGFTPGAGTKVTEVSGTSMIVDHLPGTSTPLSYDTTYYIKLIAKDRDGANPTASGQGSASISKVASGDVSSIGADLIVPGTGFVNALVVNAGGSIQSNNWSSQSAGWKISPTGIEMNDDGSTIKADAIKAGTLGGPSGSGVINIAAGTSLVLNGGYIKSNTYTGTAYNASATAGFYLGNDGLVIAQGAVKASTLTTGDIASASITLSSTAEIKTSGYVHGTSTSGFRLSPSGLQIPDGSLEAAKLIITSAFAQNVQDQVTTIDGGKITTGSIQSGQLVTVNGAQVPAWSINTGGYASFAGAQILGNTVLGSAATDTTSRIQSYNYVAGSSGWMIRADGTAELSTASLRGSLTIGQVSNLQTELNTLDADIDTKVSTINSGAGVKTFTNPLVWRQTGSGMSGAIVIDTPITFSNYMCNIKIAGFNYRNNQATIAMDIGFYATSSTSFVNTVWSNYSSTPIAQIRLARKTSTNTVSILINRGENALWYYPQINVYQALIGHVSPPDSFKDGWDASIITSLTGYDLVTDITSSGTDFKDTSDRTNSWTYTGTTQIDGGNIRADTVTAVELNANAITAKHTITGAKFQTSSSSTAKRVIIDGASASEIQLHSGGNETNPGRINIAGQYTTSSGPVLYRGTTGSAIGSENYGEISLDSPNLGSGRARFIAYASDSERIVEMRGNYLVFNVEGGKAIGEASTNSLFKLRTDTGSGAAGSSLVLRGGMVVAGIESYNASTPNSNNTMPFYASDIRSTGSGVYDEGYAGGGGTSCNVNNNGRFIRAGSSKRYKKAIKPLTSKVARLALDLESVSFQWRKNMDLGDARVGGFLAEQVHDAGMGWWVTYDKKGRPDGVRYGELTAAHNVIIKEHDDDIAALKSENADMKHRLAALEAKVALLTNN